jgi:hypothetical protein
MTDLSGTVAIITGASRGIGAAAGEFVPSSSRRMIGALSIGQISSRGSRERGLSECPALSTRLWAGSHERPSGDLDCRTAVLRLPRVNKRI